MQPPAQSVLTRVLKSSFLSRDEVAADLGVTRQTVHNWCSRRVRIPLDHLQRLSDYLAAHGVDRSDISALIQEELRTAGFHDFQYVASDRTRIKSEGRRAGRSPVLVVIWDGRRQILRFIAQACIDQLQKAGFPCLLLDCAGRQYLQRFYLRRASDLDCSAVLIVGVQGDLPDPVDDLADTSKPLTRDGIPMVLVSSWTPSIVFSSDVAGVGWDWGSLCEVALASLRQWGHSQVGIVLKDSVPGHTEKHRVLDHVLHSQEHSGLIPQVIWLSEENPEVMASLQRLVTSCTAVFVPPSTLESVAKACYEAQYAWPDDVSILSFGHHECVPRLGVRPFSFIALPLEEIVQQASRLLLGRIQEESVQMPHLIVYKTEFMALISAETGSLGPPRSSSLVSV